MAIDKAWTTISPERFSWLVLDTLFINYHVKLPAAYVAEGEARAFCDNFIATAYGCGLRVDDAAFVLCNKIQSRAWENGTRAPASVVTTRYASYPRR